MASAVLGRLIFSPEWWDKMHADGVVPDMVQRMVIDVPLEGVVKVYFECLASEELLTEDVIETLIKGGDIVTMGSDADCAEDT